jgi:ferritin
MKLDVKMAALLTEHITRERFAEAAYFAVGNWADRQSFSGLQTWADGEAKDERNHYELVQGYLRDRGVATLQSVPAPTNTFGSYVEALKYLLRAEDSVTGSLNEIMAHAAQTGDMFTSQALWSLLAVQVHSTKTLQDLIIRVERGAPIDLLDLQMFEGL